MEWISIDEVCRPRQWKTIAMKNLKEEGYPVYGANGIIGYYDEYTHEENTIMITCRGATCGTINMSIGKSYINGNAMALDNLNEEVINKNYLYYYLLDYDFTDIISGSAQPQITRANLSRLKIPVPPIEIQKQIVEVLDEAQKLIDKRKKQIELLDDLIESIFYDMFGEPVKNEKGWEVKKLGEFYDIKTGKTPKRGVVKYWDNPEINWIKTGEILNGVINSSEERISKVAKEELNMYLFNKGDILIAMYGQGNTRGRVAKLNLKATTNQACAGLVKKEGYIINNEYIYNILLLLYEQLRSLGRGGNQPNLNLGMIREYEVPIPPIQLQNQFAEKVEAIESQKALMEESLKLMEDNYNSLMQRAFKGELFNNQ